MAFIVFDPGTQPVKIKRVLRAVRYVVGDAIIRIQPLYIEHLRVEVMATFLYFDGKMLGYEDLDAVRVSIDPVRTKLAEGVYCDVDIPTFDNAYQQTIFPTFSEN